MRKLLKSLACFAAAALVGTVALADGLNAGNTLTIGGNTTDWSLWSQSGDSPTDLGYVSDLTVTDARLFWWADFFNNGANMYFTLWDGGDQPVGAWQDVWLGNSTYVGGEYGHDYTVDGPDGGAKDLNSTWGVSLEEGKTYYLDVKVRTYNNSSLDGSWYPSSDGDAYYHAKFTYCTTLQKFVYNLNGGDSCDVMELQLPIGSTYDGAEQAVWANHWFRGWWTEPTGGTRYQNGKSVVPDNNGEPIQLYAHWAVAQVITLHANGGTCSKETVTRPVGNVYWDLPAAPTRDGYSFLGWFTAAEGGDRVKNGDTVTGGATLDLYAHWALQQVITLHANGGTCPKDSVTRPVGNVYWGLPAAPTRDGYSFLGWFTAADGGDRVKNGDTVTGGATLDLYAHWAALQVVTLHANGGTCSRDSVTRPVGNVYWYLPLSPTLEGHAFLGWFADDEEGAPRVKNGDVVTDALTRDLYAHWKENAAPATASKAAKGKRDATVTDELTVTSLGITATAYNNGNFSDKQVSSDAKYAGQAIKNGTAIQLRKTSPCGIVTTASGGKAKKVTVAWNSGTTSGRYLTVYGNNSAYSTAANLYSSGTRGTELGTITYGTSTSLDITDDYEYIGLLASGGNTFVDSVSIEWASSSGGGQSVTLSPSGPISAEIGDEVEIEASADGFSGEVTWSWTGSGTPNGNKFTVDTSAAVEAATITATATYGTDESVSQSVVVTVTAPKHTITIDSAIENGTVTTTPSGEAAEGATVTVNTTPDPGYKLGTITVNDVALAAGVTTFTMPSQNVTVSATFVELSGDVLTRATTGVTGNSYDNWTATGTSGTKYAGNSAGGNSSIQLNTSSPKGLVITESTGRDVTSVTVEWNNATSANNSIEIYGSANAYTGPAALHSADTRGASLGSLTKGQTTLSVPTGNPYIGILAKDGAVYLTSVTIEFAAAAPSVTLSPSGALEVYVNDPVTITATPHDFSGEVEWTWYVNNAAVAGATAATFALDTSVAGSYAVTAMANYGNDEMAESDPLNVTVKTPSTPHAIEIETDDNGTVTADPNPAMEGVTVTLTAVPNEGYRLDYVESDEVTITDMQFVMPNQNVGVYAYFEGKHDVVIDDQIVNGSVVASPATAFSDETVTLTVQPDAGYKLDTLTVLDEDLNEIPVTDMSFVMPKGDVLVSATFVELADLYFQFETSESWTGYGDATIAFVNTGSTAEDVPTVSFDTSRTLRGTGSTDKKVGSASIRMAPLKDQDAVVVNAAAFEQAIAKVAFQYAKYGTDSFDSFTVQVSADGETWSDLATQPAAPTTSLQTYVNENVPEGMKFIRFVTTNSGSSNDHRFNIDEIQIWLADVPMQTFLYDVNDGGTGEASCEVQELSMPIGSTYDGAVQAVWASHWFRGWWTDPTGGTRYQNGKSVVPDNGGEAIQLYAHWAVAQVITLHPNGGTCSKETVTRPVGNVYWDLPAAPTREGYSFLGWFTALEGGDRVKNGDTVTGGATLDLYAHWALQQVITLHPNGGTCSKETVTRPVGNVYWDLPAAPTRDGYSFLGWFTALDGGDRVKNGDTVTGGATLDLYAHWAALQVITLHANGGTCSRDSVTRPVGNVYWYLPLSPTLDGHAFLGWFADDEEGAPRVKNGDVVTDALTRDLYAHWKERTAPLAITGFSMASRTAAPAARSSAGDTVECTLWVTTVATLDYEIRWTDDLSGEWTVLKRWTAEADGSTPVKVEIPADANSGFFGVVEIVE